jgi:hypothetical protein
MNADDASPWDIRGADFPIGKARAIQLEYLVRYAVLAPSTHNSQPWRFGVRGEALEVSADRTRSLPHCDPNDRELTISCATAFRFAWIAARNYGWEGIVELLPDPRNPDLLARLRLGQPIHASYTEVRRFNAIVHRRTNRTRFTTDPLVNQRVQELPALARNQPDTGLAVTSDPGVRRAVAALVYQADRRQMAEPAHRQELAKWIKPTDQAISADGMSLASFGMSDRLTAATSALMDVLDIGPQTATRHKRLAEASPWLGLLTTVEDEKRAWLYAGMALADIVLDLAANDIACSFLDQPIQVLDLRPELARIFGVTGFPQMLLRIGRGRAVRAAPRREPESVIGP